jgi:hypothetical protein
MHTGSLKIYHLSFEAVDPDLGINLSMNMLVVPVGGWENQQTDSNIKPFVRGLLFGFKTNYLVWFYYP